MNALPPNLIEGTENLSLPPSPTGNVGKMLDMPAEYMHNRFNRCKCLDSTVCLYEATIRAVTLRAIWVAFVTPTWRSLYDVVQAGRVVDVLLRNGGLHDVGVNVLLR